MIWFFAGVVVGGLVVAGFLHERQLARRVTGKTIEFDRKRVGL